MPEPFQAAAWIWLMKTAWREAWDLKVFGYINMCRLAYARMREVGQRCDYQYHWRSRRTPESQDILQALAVMPL